MIVHLSHREIIVIEGKDRFSYLQGLISQDVFALSNDTPLLYGLLLSTRGRIQYDLFFFDDGEKLYVDTDQKQDLLKLLTIYKLRSNISISESSFFVYSIIKPTIEEEKFIENNPFYFKDPRHDEMGHRLYLKDQVTPPPLSSLSSYDQHRLTFSIPDGIKDLKKDQFFPLEWNMDKLYAISFSKGCYLGQEQTARTKHLNVLRKEVILADTSSEMFIEAQEKEHVISIYDKKAFIIVVKDSLN
ncbi:MAG: folate-binding protein YgfZ [Proteobacteria bacterium]|nr:folate-binding protein YgfZ [Pseudomonadota bacterium]